MTIAAAFCLNDSILMCADTEHSASQGKFSESKIIQWRNGKMAVLVSFAGDSQLSRATIDDYIRKLERNKATLDSLDRLLNLLQRVAAKHYANNPTDECSLMFSISWHDQLRLYETYRGYILPHGDKCCIGSGADIVRYLTDNLFKNNLSPEVALGVAAYAIGQAKIQASGVGGRTDAYLLMKNGETRPFSSEHLERLEKFMGLFVMNCRDLIIPILASDDALVEKAGIGFLYGIKVVRAALGLDDHNRFAKPGTAKVMLQEVIKPGVSSPLQITGEEPKPDKS